MDATFYIASAVAIASTFMVITRVNAVHALMYLVVSLMSLALMFFALGAPLIAALEVIIYAGAIMVLFIFVVMLLNLGSETTRQELGWFNWRMTIGPGLLTTALVALLCSILRGDGTWLPGKIIVEPKQVSLALFGPYIAVVELSSMLLLGGLVGAYFLARRDKVPSKDIAS